MALQLTQEEHGRLKFAGMRSSGLKDWLTEVTEHTNGKPFLFCDLPDDLRSMKWLYRARDRGFVEKVDRTTTNNRCRGIFNVWQVIV